MGFSKWGLLISGIAVLLLCFIIFDTRANKQQEQQTSQLSQHLSEAMYDVAVNMDWDFSKESSRTNYITSFKNCLATSLHYSATEGLEDFMMRRIPVMILAGNDGFWCYYTDTYTDATGFGMYTKTMSNKIPYTYTYGSYVVKFSFTGMVSVVFKTNGNEYTGLASDVYVQLGSPTELAFFADDDEYMTRLGDIASQMIGETMESMIHDRLYEFDRLNSYVISLPAGETHLIRGISGPCTIAMYQDHTSSMSDGSAVDVYSIAACDLAENIKYTVIKEDIGGQPYLYYHKDGCTHTGVSIFKGTMKECAQKGAFPCPDCCSFR